MTIDEICREVESNGFSSLSDSEIKTYIDWECKKAERDGRFSAECNGINKALSDLAENQHQISEYARETLQKLLDEPLKLERIDA